LGIPKGEPDEKDDSLLATAKREVLEETGLNAKESFYFLGVSFKRRETRSCMGMLISE